MNIVIFRKYNNIIIITKKKKKKKKKKKIIIKKKKKKKKKKETKTPRISSRSLFIKWLNTSGVFLRPNDMTVYSKCPYLTR